MSIFFRGRVTSPTPTQKSVYCPISHTPERTWLSLLHTPEVKNKNNTLPSHQNIYRLGIFGLLQRLSNRGEWSKQILPVQCWGNTFALVVFDFSPSAIYINHIAHFTEITLHSRICSSMHVLSDPEMHKSENNKSQDAKKKTYFNKNTGRGSKNNEFSKPLQWNECQTKPKKSNRSDFHWSR